MDDSFIHGKIQSSDFIVHVSGNQQSPDTFQGSEDGTDVTIGFGSYSVSETPSPDVSHHNAEYNLVKIVKGYPSWRNKDLYHHKSF
jgi:hypothetical protein